MESLEETSLQEDFDTVVLQMLAATESLYEAVTLGMEVYELDELYDRRAEAFRVLQSLASRGISPDAAARAGLARIRSLDGEMLSAAVEQVDEIRDARHKLRRRRSVVQAHASRERGEPRLVTLKA